MEKRLTTRLSVDHLSIHDIGPVSFDIDKGACVGLSGPSGSGKSSVARAGFLPELARRPLGDVQEFRAPVFRPEGHPLENLARVLARLMTDG